MSAWGEYLSHVLTSTCALSTGTPREYLCGCPPLGGHRTHRYSLTSKKYLRARIWAAVS